MKTLIKPVKTSINETSCLHKNDKTINSIDFTTSCIKRNDFETACFWFETMRGITIDTVKELKSLINSTLDKEIKDRFKDISYPCEYCYVETARNNHFNAKKVIKYTAYNGEILKLSAKKIIELNSIGGIRLFSFGDYMPEHKQDITSMLTDCRNMNLSVKVITKVVEFINTFYYDFSDVFSIIHISIDNIKNGVEWDTALQYKAKYPKVIIRSVILREADLLALKDISDIITFNHGVNGFKFFRKAEKSELIKQHDIENKTCCVTGKCNTCTVKCGVKS